MKPTAVSRSPSAFGSGAGPGRYEAIQEYANFTSGPHAVEEPHVVLEEEAQVRDAVEEERDAVYSHPEGEPGVFLGVDPAVPEHVRVDHAGAHDLDPARARARAARGALRGARAPAEDARHRDVDARLDEREERRAETDLRIGREESPRERGERALEVRERDALAHREAFHLVEDRRVARVDVVLAVDAARNDDPDRRLLRKHRPDLDGGRVRPQEQPVA